MAFRICTLIICFCICFQSSFCQDGEEKKERKYSFHFSFDGRRSFVNKEPNDLAGLRLGLEHNQKRFRYGLGAYFLKSEIVSEEKFVNQLGDTLDIHYSFGYPSVWFEKILLRNEKWELASGVHLGAGNHEVKTGIEGLNNFEVIEQVKSTVWELSGTADYYLTDWLAFGTGAGYRIIVGANEDIRKSYSSPIYIVKAKIKIFKLHQFITRDPNTIED
ncbi:MAG: hypothetical protein HKN75_05485 [Bacteroidia bacterium]|nr:hypothetical protein [Bacteroidia bacterium]